MMHSLSQIHRPVLLLLLHPLYWAQYCINIFIYVFMNKQYRDAYVNYIARWWPDFKEVAHSLFVLNDAPSHFVVGGTPVNLMFGQGCHLCSAYLVRGATFTAHI